MKNYFTNISLKSAALSFIIAITISSASFAQETNEKQFQTWLMRFAPEAESAGISNQTIYSFMKEAQYLPKVIELDRKQPDKMKSFDQYLKGAMPASRIKKAKEKYKENHKILTEIGKKYGVQPRFIVALWGSESDFGRNMGSFNTLNCLATLAFEGRRADFFKSELINALKMIDSDHINQEDIKGSWAGAMGQTQFMPSSFLQLAVDYNQDGKKDIWDTKADVFASIANYLSESGWDSSVTWGREIKLPHGFSEKLIGKHIDKSISEWNKLGIKTINGKNLPAKKGLMASVIKVEDKEGSRAFLIYPNYKILLKWNRSLYFATTVSMLADKIGN